MKMLKNVSSKYDLIKVIGCSMKPFLKSGDYVWINKNIKKFYPGDIILYELNGQKFIHRIKKIYTDYAVIIDDTGVINEQLVLTKNIIGKQITILNNIPGLIYNYIITFIFKLYFKLKKSFKKISLF